MNAVQPTFAPFLRSIKPHRFSPPAAPPCPLGCIAFISQGWRLELDDDVICHVSRSPAERGAREQGTGLQLEPDSPSSFEIAAVYLRGKDVSSDLNEDQIFEIEKQAVREIAEKEQ